MRQQDGGFVNIVKTKTTLYSIWCVFTSSQPVIYADLDVDIPMLYGHICAGLTYIVIADF